MTLNSHLWSLACCSLNSCLKVWLSASNFWLMACCFSWQMATCPWICCLQVLILDSAFWSLACCSFISCLKVRISESNFWLMACCFSWQMRLLSFHLLSQSADIRFTTLEDVLLFSDLLSQNFDSRMTFLVSSHDIPAGNSSLTR